ncbi:DUF756 domain-containing protein [Chryseobacterium sp. LC2016-27]|uniref:phospholipase domain-containing protein n=1 Tax=Chryseobacterium sp. LC2016-27 TaxID=2897326 RepID=UPI001E4068DB|nr:phospholipase domain-containing protein [Chryseobacterium sp. LC2016-27]MCD0456635.1 DUF756 domain-containing protein [Chryseobacterium sp. LC2016-27]
MKPSTLLPCNYDVNLQNNKIVMTNLKETPVSLIIYDKNKFNTKDYYFSYTLPSNDEISHTVNIEKYSYEVIGSSGFVRKFKGTKKPELNVNLSTNILKHEIDIKLTNISANTLNISLENKYTDHISELSLTTQEEKININLDRSRGWYDFKIRSNTNIWHFAGRVEFERSAIGPI